MSGSFPSDFKQDYDRLVGLAGARFSSAGLLERAAVPISSGVDPSVIFVGSVTNCFKAELLGTAPLRPEFVVQPAIRTHNLTAAREWDRLPKWTSFFFAIGFVAPLNLANRVIPETVALIYEILGQRVGRALSVQVLARDVDLRSLLSEAQVPVDVVDNDPDEAFVHRYGHPHLAGRNFNFGLSHADGSFATLGNLVVIESADRPIALEFGLGSWTVLAAAASLSHPLLASPVARAMPLETIADFNCADSISAATALLAEGVRPNSSSRGKIVRGYLRKAARLRRPGDNGITCIARGATAMASFLGLRDAAAVGEAVAEYVALDQRLEAAGVSPPLRARTLAEVL